MAGARYAVLELLQLAVTFEQRVRRRQDVRTLTAFLRADDEKTSG
jgi:hypothetical protein